MRQPHKNLFFYYRGGDDNADDDAFERQLENNATKALIYVLENASREVVLEPFLRQVVGLKGALRSDETRFALQKRDIHRPDVRTRVALTLTPTGNPIHQPSAKKAGCPDAWIWVEAMYGVLVETKVVGDVSHQQVNRHIDGAEGWSRKKTRVVHRTWTDLYRFFTTVRVHRGVDTFTKHLLEELVRYMRITGLAHGTTFDLDDFGYFIARTGDRESDERRIVQRKLHAFAESLARSKGVRRFVKRSGGNPRDPVHPGKFKKDADNHWITIGGKERRHRVHFTVRVGQDGITLEAFSPHLKFTKRLLSKLEAEPKAFLRSLRSIGKAEPYLIRLRESHYKDPTSHYKGRSIGRRIDFLLVHPRTVNEQNLATLILEPLRMRLRKKDRRPEMFLVRHFPLDEVVGNAAIVDAVAAAADKMLGYMKFATL